MNQKKNILNGWDRQEDARNTRDQIYSLRWLHSQEFLLHNDMHTSITFLQRILDYHLLVYSQLRLLHF